MADPKKETAGEKMARWVFQSTALVVFLALWEIAPRLGWIDGEFVPPLSSALQEMWRLTLTGELLIHIGASLGRAVIGFGLATVVAVPLGFLLGGWFKTFEKILDPLLQIFGQVNPFSLFPLFILFFGIGEVAKVAIILWVCIWPILSNTISGVQNIDPLLVKSARSMGTSKITLFLKVVLPGASPSIFTGIKMGASTSFLMIIAAEMIGANEGLGYLIHVAEMNYLIPMLFAGVVTIAILGILITNLIGKIEKRVVSWKQDVYID